MRLAVFCGVAIFASSLASFAQAPAFDAASVKIADPGLRPPFTPTGGPGTNDPGQFRAPHEVMVALLLRAFGVEQDQISGPAWFRDVARSQPAYSIAATMPPDTTKEQFQKMLQNLLVERFHLVFHREARNFPGYELVVDKGGPKFKEVAAAQASSDADRDPRAVLTGPKGEDGFPVASGPRRFNQSRPGGDDRWKYQEWTMAEFATNLPPLISSSQDKDIVQQSPTNPLPRVADKTGLTGKYTFILEFYNPRAIQLGGLLRRDGADNAPPPAPDPSGAPNIFVAVQKQLGLRLDKTPGVPLDVIVVDSVDKVPAEN